jgi:hypothetical protein
MGQIGPIHIVALLNYCIILYRIQRKKKKERKKGRDQRKKKGWRERERE